MRWENILNIIPIGPPQFLDIFILRIPFTNKNLFFHIYIKRLWGRRGWGGCVLCEIPFMEFNKFL